MNLNSMYDIQDFSRQRMKDLRREADKQRLVKYIRQGALKRRTGLGTETRYESRGNASPLWARIWSLF